MGEAANYIGNRFWEHLAFEHGLDLKGAYSSTDMIDERLDRVGVFFNESDRGRFTPRTVFVDLDSASLDLINSGSSRELFGPDNFAGGGKQSTNSNWAKGFYTDGDELLKEGL